jgi:hypothetical protein
MSVLSAPHYHYDAVAIAIAKLEAAADRDGTIGVQTPTE